MPAQPAQIYPHLLPLARQRWYLITAGLIAATTFAYTAWRDALGSMPGEPVFEIYSLLMTLLIVTWLVSDPELAEDQRPSFDHGLLLWMTFPVFALYQLFTTRRWRGVLILFALMLLYLVPSLAVLVTEIVLAF